MTTIYISDIINEKRRAEELGKEIKQEVIEQLYCLRAGMSLLDNEAEKVKKLLDGYYNKTEEIEKEIVKYQKETEKSLTAENRLRKKYEKEKEILSLEASEAKIKARDWESGKLKAKYIVKMMPSGLSCVLSLGFIVFLFCLTANYGIWYVGIFASIIPTILLIIFVNRFKKRIKDFQEHLRWYKDYKEKGYKNVSPYADYKERFQEKLNLIIAKREQANEEIETLMERKLNIFSEKEKAEEITKNAMIVYQDLVEKFSSILDVRDWKLLDHIIFTLETGRAETIKEALVQTDQQVNTEKIIHAIHTSSENIRSTFNRQLASLKGAINGFAQELGQKYEANNKILGEIAVATEMQNALVEKIGTSSDKLANNIDRMRMFAEQKYIKGE